MYLRVRWQTFEKEGVVVFTKGSSAAKVYRLLYERRHASKQMVAHELGLSMPTVSKALATLVDAGLVSRTNVYASTGGRPAVAFELVTDARFGLGVELVADELHLAAVDLYGNVLAAQRKPLAFYGGDGYLDEVARLVTRLVASLDKPREALLGITIAIQGIVSETGRLGFSELLGTGETNISLEDFSRRLPYPVRLVHDAEAAAYAELWRHREMTNFVYLSLNDHMGSALVLGGQLLDGGPLGAGVVEHMVLDPKGARCYCGNRGCADTVLGIHALEAKAQLPLEDFFALVRAEDRRSVTLWERYLSDLALLIRNVRMVACCDVILGGRLERHLREEDLRKLRQTAGGDGALGRVPFRLTHGHYGFEATVIGAGLLSVEEFHSSMGASA